MLCEEETTASLPRGDGPIWSTGAARAGGSAKLVRVSPRWDPVAEGTGSPHGLSPELTCATQSRNTNGSGKQAREHENQWFGYSGLAVRGRLRARTLGPVTTKPRSEPGGISNQLRSIVLASLRPIRPASCNLGGWWQRLRSRWQICEVVLSAVAVLPRLQGNRIRASTLTLCTKPSSKHVLARISDSGHVSRSNAAQRRVGGWDQRS